MLNSIRDHAKGWFSWLLVVVISVPFAFWGINEYMSVGDRLPVAEVNGIEIDQQQYRAALDNQRQFLMRQAGEQANPAMFNDPAFKRGVLEAMIQRALLKEDTERAGYRIGDAQLAGFIRSVPQFQREGKFDPRLYEQVLLASREGSAVFEDRLRQQHAIEQVRHSFTESSFVTTQELERLLRLSTERREFSHVVFPAADAGKDVSVPGGRIEQEYRENQAAYRTPERMRVEYLRLSPRDYASDIKLSEEDLRRVFESRKQKLRVPEQRRASHILIKLPEKADAPAMDEALRKAGELARRARAGEDFAKLAKDYSQDAGSAKAGGDLGGVAPGTMVKPFEDAVFRLNAGEISEPVKSEFGYHVIKLTELTPERVPEFETVRKQLEAEERQTQAEARFLEQAETFRNLVFEQPDSLTPAAEQLGLKVEQSDWFTRERGIGIASDARVRDVAFGDEVMLRNVNSEAMEIAGNALLSVRKLDIEAPRQRPLDEVRAEIEQQLRRKFGKEEAARRGSAMVSTLELGGDWNRLLVEHKLTAHESAYARTDPAPGVLRELMQVVFRAPGPAAGKAVYGGLALANGDYAVFRLNKVQEGDPAKAGDELRERLKAILKRRDGEETFTAYLQGLRSAAKVQVFEDRL
jgi:peptidyl-prolyl cis-trans isomerase D